MVGILPAARLAGLARRIDQGCNSGTNRLGKVGNVTKASCEGVLIDESVVGEGAAEFVVLGTSRDCLGEPEVVQVEALGDHAVGHR
jgi:hypothetical protein